MIHSIITINSGYCDTEEMFIPKVIGKVRMLRNLIRRLNRMLPVGHRYRGFEIRRGKLVEKLNRKNMPVGWRIQTGLNPDYFISVKRWAKERGRQVAEARKSGNVDTAIKALEEGKSYKNGIKETLKGVGTEYPYFVYDPEGKCRYILEQEITKKWTAYTAEG